MKTCTKCKKRFSEELFYLKKGKRKSICKFCQAKYWKEWYANPENKRAHIAHNKITSDALIKRDYAYIDEYLKSHPCSECGEERITVLQFHHRDDETKDDCVSNLAHSGYSIKRIQNEIDKCDVLCANCHLVRHHG